MKKVILFFEHGETVDEMHVEAETIEELQKIADDEVIRRNPETHWSSPVTDC
ncbi:MAG: hypothetical protein ACR2PS_05620 [Pseudomonadales bacterium]